jgi:hypothetical protein
MTDARTLAELFRVPPEQFTAARNRLVAELRRAGKGPAAAAIARLPRPTLVVWAINQAAQQDRAAVDRLLATADELKDAQLGRARTAVPVAAKAYQDAVAALVERSLGQVTSAGHAATAATRTRLTGTLMAAATDPALRQPLREGRLSREQATAGFEVFRDAPPALRVVKPSAAPRPEMRQPPGSPAPAEDHEAARRQAQARVRLETARADLARAASRAEELTKTEAELRKVALEARQRAAAARRAASQGREEVTRARAKVTAAEKAARDR